MFTPEDTQQSWETEILPIIQGSLNHPFKPAEPPLNLVSNYITEGLSLTRAVVKIVAREARGLENICHLMVPLFPPDIPWSMFNYAPLYVDLAERLIEGISVNDILGEQVRNVAAAGEPRNETNIRAFRDVLIKIVPVQTADRTGFSLINIFTSEMSLASFNNDPYPDISSTLVVLGGERYKTIYIEAGSR